jgi:hypothetical protein
VRSAHGENRWTHEILAGKCYEMTHARKLGIAGRILLKLNLEKQGAKVWTGFNWLRLEPSDWLF